MVDRIARKLLLTASLLSVLIAGCDSSPLAPTATDYIEGESVQLNVQFGDGLLCTASARDLRTGEVVVVSQRAVVVADVENPSNGFTREQYRSLAATFDEQIWPTITGNFGVPLDIDGNQRIVLFFTRAVNELAPSGQKWYVGGVFAARDLFPRQDRDRLRGCAGSNFGELIYMPVPDPTGEVNGNVRDRASELRIAPGLLAHELQHVINGSRRLYAGTGSSQEWSEATWLNEGMSHVAEELLTYAASGLGPRRNLGMEEFVGSTSLQNAFSRYLQPNFQWLAYYLENPDTTSIYGDDSRATRGAAWQFLRYAADRRGGSEAVFWRTLVDAPATGLSNLRAALGTEPAEWINDWLVSIYMDDKVAGASARFTQPSWNYRSLYRNLPTTSGSAYGNYPLLVRDLTDGIQQSLSIAAGSAAYLTFAVPALERAEIRTSNTAAGCREGGPSYDLATGESIRISGNNAGAVCVNGGADGAEFVYIPFLAAEAGRVDMVVRASGIAPLTASATTSAVRLQRSNAEPAEDRTWESEFRAREQRELSSLVQGRVSATVRAANLVSNDVRVTIVRVR